MGAQLVSSSLALIVYIIFQFTCGLLTCSGFSSSPACGVIAPSSYGSVFVLFEGFCSPFL